MIPPVPASHSYVKLPTCYSTHNGRHRPDPTWRKFSTSKPMNMKTTELVSLASTAAEAFDECDKAQMLLNESFGLPYEAAKDSLLRDVTIAESEGLDLSIFSGEQSRFRFPIYNTNIIVRVHKKPTAHQKLNQLSEKVRKLEQELKLAKTMLKHTAEQLVLKGECDEQTDKIVLAFTRLKK